MNKLEKYSLGIGDRFAQQGEYQLAAIVEAEKQGVIISPVWNRSHREHQELESKVLQVKIEADNAVGKLGWKHSYFIDADKITRDTVDSYVKHANYFSIDVANQVGRSFDNALLKEIIGQFSDHPDRVELEGVNIDLNEDIIAEMAKKFYQAASEVSRVYEKLTAITDSEFVLEVSMDEADRSQSAVEWYFILHFLAKMQVPVNVVGPKFKGAFKKGVDYQESVDEFADEFEKFIVIIKHIAQNTTLPDDLKLVVHSGSDKFSLYPVMNKLMNKHDVGIHLKTSGTTWLEELIGLAESGEGTLDMVKSIYGVALNRYDITIQKYGNMLNINLLKLPTAQEAMSWSGKEFSAALTHDPSNDRYNSHMRQLLHTAYKIAHEKGDHYLQALAANREYVGQKVKNNLYQRHIKPLFLGASS